LVAVAVSVVVADVDWGSLAMVASSFSSLLRRRVERPPAPRKRIVHCIIGVRREASSVPHLDVVSEPSTNRRNASLTVSGLNQSKRVRTRGKKMLKAFSRLWNNERGNMIVIAAA